MVHHHETYLEPKIEEDYSFEPKQEEESMGIDTNMPSDLEPIRPRPPRIIRCSMCKKFEESNKMSTSLIDSEKLILMVAGVISNECTIQKAKEFLSTLKLFHYVCQQHFFMATDEIRGFLSVRYSNSSSIVTCSAYALRKLMVTVIALSPQTNTPKFLKGLRQFGWDDTTKLDLTIGHSVRARRSRSQEKGRNVRCSMCKKFENTTRMKSAITENEKLILMVGNVISRDSINDSTLKLTPKQATLFLNTLQSIHFVCRQHFYDSITEICSFLGVKHSKSVATCTHLETQNRLMIIVNSIDPIMTFEDFHVVLSGCDEEGDDGDEMVEEEEIVEPPRSVPLSTAPSSTSISNSFGNHIYALQPLPPLPQFKIPQHSGYPANGLKSIGSLSERNHRQIVALTCALCSKRYPRALVSLVSAANDKLILAVGFSLAGRLTLESAKSFSGDRSSSTPVCKSHFMETMLSIFDVLQIESLDEIDLNPTESMRSLMRIVKCCRKSMSYARFNGALNEFVMMHSPPVQTSPVDDPFALID